MASVHGWIQDHRLLAHSGDVVPPQIAVAARRRLRRTEHIGARTQRIELAIEAELRARAQRPKAPLDVERGPIVLGRVVLRKRRQEVELVEAEARRAKTMKRR